MRFSIFHIPTAWTEKDDAPIISMVTEQSLCADEAGFAAVFLPEHHFSGYSPTGSDAVAFGAYLAPQLKQAYIGFAVQVLPLHHPARFVERLNLLDQLTKGRLIAGIGSGIEPVETVGFGMTTEDMVNTVFDENLNLALKMWEKKIDDPPVEFATKYYKGNLLPRIVPSSWRKPRPILMGVAAREKGTLRSGRLGFPVFVFAFDGWAPFLARLQAYRKELLAANHSKEILQEAVRWCTHTLTTVVVADTEEEAQREAMIAARAHQRHVDRLHGWEIEAMKIQGLNTPPFKRDMTNPFIIKNTFIYGTPDSVTAQLKKYEEIGIGNVNMSFNFGVYDTERRKLADKWMRLFIKEVLPRFDKTDPPLEVLEMRLDDMIAEAGGVKTLNPFGFAGAR